MDPIYVQSQQINIFGIKLEPIYEKLQFEALRILGPNLKEKSKYEPNIFIFLISDRARTLLHVRACYPVNVQEAFSTSITGLSLGRMPRKP